MGNPEAQNAPPSLPPGHRPIPIHLTNDQTPLRICVLARETPDPVNGHLVILRNLHDAVVYLGCVCDAGGRLREWIEISVQTVDGLEASLPGIRESFSNKTLDDRWSEECRLLARLDPVGTLMTGWEQMHPHPAFLDRKQATVLFPGTGKEGESWELCQDDKALADAGLPEFRLSLFRYLWKPKDGVAGKFIPVTFKAPENEHCEAHSVLFEAAADPVPFNLQAGLMRCTHFSPLGFEDYVDLLGGKPWKGLEQGKKHLSFPPPYSGLDDWQNIQQSGAHLFLGFKGRAGKVVETFHLKVNLVTEIIRLVQAFSAPQQLPFLNLSSESFRVHLNSVGRQLPLFWTARPQLVKTGEAFALPIDVTEARYFIRARSSGENIFLPEGLDRRLQSSGSIRLRQVLSESRGLVVEGTLILQERQEFSPNDLFWVRLPLSRGRVDLYGHLYKADSLSREEVRFRTIPTLFPDAVIQALKAAEGASFPRTPFEVVPLLSSPCDLYSLGVLAVRALLVNDQNNLPVALDEFLSLGAQIRAESSAEIPLGRRVKAAMEKDPRFLNSLGAHRLVRDNLDPRQAFAFLPEELWCETLAVLLRLFPGLVQESICKDYGDVPSLALDGIYKLPLAELEKILIRSRSLIVIDWNSNREIQDVLSACLKGLV